MSWPARSCWAFRRRNMTRAFPGLGRQIMEVEYTRRNFLLVLTAWETLFGREGSSKAEHCQLLQPFCSDFTWDYCDMADIDLKRVCVGTLWSTAEKSLKQLWIDWIERITILFQLPQPQPAAQYQAAAQYQLQPNGQYQQWQPMQYQPPLPPPPRQEGGRPPQSQTPMLTPGQGLMRQAPYQSMSGLGGHKGQRPPNRQAPQAANVPSPAGGRLVQTSRNGQQTPGGQVL